MPEGHVLHRLAREHEKALADAALTVSSPQGRLRAAAADLDGTTLMFSTRIDTPAEARDALVELLNARLADALDVYSQLKRRTGTRRAATSSSCTRCMHEPSRQARALPTIALRRTCSPPYRSASLGAWVD